MNTNLLEVSVNNFQFVRLKKFLSQLDKRMSTSTLEMKMTKLKTQQITNVIESLVLLF